MVLLKNYLTVTSTFAVSTFKSVGSFFIYLKFVFQVWSLLVAKFELLHEK